MNRLTKKALLIVVAGLLPAFAVTSQLCPTDQTLLSQKTIQSVCWNCIFPMAISGMVVKSGDPAVIFSQADFNIPDGEAIESGYVKGMPPDRGTIPPLCGCFDDGKSTFGITASTWLPTHIVETTRNPSCSRALGVQLPSGPTNELNWGSKQVSGTTTNESGGTFYNYHQVFFPITQVLNLTKFSGCAPDARVDLDLGMMSEYLPYWSDDMTAFFLAPEAAAAMLPIAELPCMTEAITASFGRPINKLWWCMGGWGRSLPPSGNTPQQLDNQTQIAALLGSRAMYMSHRFGMSMRTYKEDTLCKPRISRLFPKTQYKWQLLNPIADAKRAMWIGANTLRWSTGKQAPLKEDPMMLLFRFNDCCISIK
jgi:conjugal transfer pilus assembly protein TraU